MLKGFREEVPEEAKVWSLIRNTKPLREREREREISNNSTVQVLRYSMRGNEEFPGAHDPVGQEEEEGGPAHHQAEVPNYTKDGGTLRKERKRVEIPIEAHPVGKGSSAKQAPYLVRHENEGANENKRVEGKVSCYHNPKGRQKI